MTTCTFWPKKKSFKIDIVFLLNHTCVRCHASLNAKIKCDFRKNTNFKLIFKPTKKPYQKLRNDL